MKECFVWLLLAGLLCKRLLCVVAESRAAVWKTTLCGCWKQGCCLLCVVVGSRAAVGKTTLCGCWKQGCCVKDCCVWLLIAGWLCGRLLCVVADNRQKAGLLSERLLCVVVESRVVVWQTVWLLLAWLLCKSLQQSCRVKGCFVKLLLAGLFKKDCNRAAVKDCFVQLLLAGLFKKRLQQSCCVKDCFV